MATGVRIAPHIADIHAAHYRLGAGLHRSRDFQLTAFATHPLSRGHTLEALHITTLLCHGDMKYLGQIGAGAILGVLFPRSRTTPD